METERQLLDRLLCESGAVAWGVVPAAEVPAREWQRFEDWLAKGYHADMDYMERHKEIRRDPRLLLEGARTIVSVAYSYRQENPYPGLATYALGEDYHKVLRRRLKKVVAGMKNAFGGEWRICIDSAPLLERYWAERAGVGRRNPVHGNIMVDGVGSMVFLAELVTTLAPAEGPSSILMRERAGLDPECGAASTRGKIVAAVCPGGALKEGGTVDARRCINYLTLEKREELSEEERRLTGGVFFGCDICLRSSGEHRGNALPVVPEFLPLPGLEAILRGEKNEELLRSPINRKYRRR